MKKQLYFILFLLLAAGVAITLAVSFQGGVSETNNDAIIQTVPRFPSVEATTISALIGSVVGAPSDGTTLAEYSYSSLDDDTTNFFSGHDYLSSASPYEGVLYPTVVTHEESDEGFRLLEHNLLEGTSREITLFPVQGFSPRIESVAVSRDGDTAYIVLTHEVEDYSGVWGDPSFSLDEYFITTALYAVSLANGEKKLLHTQTEAAMTYAIRHVSNRFLVLSFFPTEADWHSLRLFDLADNTIHALPGIQDQGGSLTRLSPNGRFLAVNQELFSKAGNFDPSKTVVIDLETKQQFDLPFVRMYDWGISVPMEGPAVWPSKDWYDLVWDTDNRTLYAVQTTTEESDTQSFRLFAIDLVLRTITEEGTIPSDDLIASLNGTLFVGIEYTDRYEIRSESDNGLVAQFDPPQYPFLSPSLVIGLE